MRRLRFLLLCGVLVFATSTAFGQAKEAAGGANKPEEAPTLEQLELPGEKAPDEAPAAEALAAQPSKLVYVGPEGSFLLDPGRSRGMFRWSGTYWANSISYAFEDSNYWIYRLDGTNGWFAFGRNPSGGTYVVWKGLGTSSSITWQDKPSGWMRATRGNASGNRN